MASALSNAIESLFNEAGAQFIATFSKRADAILEDHRRHIDALVHEVHGTAARMFDLTLAPETDAEAFRMAQEPYWVTERVASALIPDFGRMIDGLLPAALRKRRRRSRIIAQTEELVDRNAEGLRWSILRGLDETFRLAAAQFEERLADAISATRHVIEEALARRREKSSVSEATLEDLERTKNALLTVKRALDALVLEAAP